MNPCLNNRCIVSTRLWWLLLYSKYTVFSHVYFIIAVSLPLTGSVPARRRLSDFISGKLSSFIFTFWFLQAVVFHPKQPAGLPKETQGKICSLTWPFFFYFFFFNYQYVDFLSLKFQHIFFFAKTEYFLVTHTNIEKYLCTDLFWLSIIFNVTCSTYSNL